MRVALVTVVLAGCHFHPNGSAVGGDDVASDANDDATVFEDAMPIASCGAGYTVDPMTNHSYKLTTADYDRDGAFDACAAEGAHLATISDARENAFVRTIGSDAWIGADDLRKEGTFTWVDGTPFAFTAWNTGEPSNANGREDCAYMRPATTPDWNDTNCGDKRKAVCECEAGYTPPPPKPCRGMQGSIVDGRLYFVRSMSATWQQAQDNCTGIGAHLLVIGDGAENTFVDDGDKLNVGQTILLGLTRAANQWSWVDASPYGYTNWDTSAGAPFAGGGQECAVHQPSNQKWINLSCSSNQKFVCECEP